MQEHIDMGLDTIEFILWAEKEFQIEIPDEDAENILTVGQFSTYVYRKLQARHGFDAPPEQKIFERIRKHLASEFKIAPDKIDCNSRFVKDLGLD
jgi:acyl carrier protein